MIIQAQVSTAANAHTVEWSDPTHSTVSRSLYRISDLLAKRRVTPAKVATVAAHIQRNPGQVSASRISRDLGNMSRLQVEAAIEALLAARRIRTVRGALYLT